jgi:Gpi18-like mannosyltransferase
MMTTAGDCPPDREKVRAGTAGGVPLGVSVGALLVVAVAVRGQLFSYVPPDFKYFLRPWWNYIVEHGGFHALAHDFSNYNPPYLYLLALLSWLSSEPLQAIKALSVFFDIVLAGVVTLIAVRLSGSWSRACFTGVAVLLVPTVFLNSAMLAQCDAIYSVFIMAGIGAAVARRSAWSAGLFGVAVAFKLQAIFLFPLLFVRVLRGDASWRSLVAAPAAFALCDVPAWFLGRPLGELASVYLGQADEFKALNLNAPSVYAFLPVGVEQAEIRRAGTLWALALCIVLVTFLSRSAGTLESWRLVQAATIIAIVVPFTLPSMHERYFYCADVLSVLVALRDPRRLAVVPVLVQAGSLAGYMSYLFGPFKLPIPACAMLAAGAILIYDFIRQGRTTARGCQLRDAHLGHADTSLTLPAYTLPSCRTAASAQVGRSVRSSVTSGAAATAWRRPVAASRWVTAGQERARADERVLDPGGR